MKTPRNEPPSSELSRQMRVNSLDGKIKKPPPDHSKLEKDFLTPFGDKKDLNLYREIEMKIKSNQDAM